MLVTAHLSHKDINPDSVLPINRLSSGDLFSELGWFHSQKSFCCLPSLNSRPWCNARRVRYCRLLKLKLKRNTVQCHWYADAVSRARQHAASERKYCPLYSLRCPLGTRLPIFNQQGPNFCSAPLKFNSTKTVIWVEVGGRNGRLKRKGSHYARVFGAVLWHLCL